ncbi:hypothetical protein ACWEQ4_01080 [Rhodococcus sp. NPDC003994]
MSTVNQRAVRRMKRAAEKRARIRAIEWAFQPSPWTRFAPWL